MAGRSVFVKLGCYECHEVKGEGFPRRPAGSPLRAPELTGMGSHHPAEYFAESILDPNAVIVTEPGYTDAQGFSIMPDYREVLTVAELIDLVAYLRSLGGGHEHAASTHPRQGQAPPLREKRGGQPGDHGQGDGHVQGDRGGRQR